MGKIHWPEKIENQADHPPENGGRRAISIPGCNG
jgi:hypothetical protein